MRVTTRAVRREIALVVLICFGSGCAVFNPNVTFPRPACPEDARRNSNCATRSYTMAQAIAYAEDAEAAYDRAIAENNWFTATFGVLVIGIAAAALGVGITDGATTAISALGAAGAGTAGIGLLLSDRSRNKIYVQGQEKIVCAVAAVSPLSLTQAQQEEFHAARNAIAPGQRGVTRQLAQVRSLIPAASDAEIIKRAKASVVLAEETLQAATEIIGPATKLDLQLSRAGTDLVLAVDQIGKEVGKVVDGTAATLEAANTIIAGLATGARTISDLPAGFNADAAKDKTSAAAEQKAANQALLEAAMATPDQQLVLATALLDAAIFELATAIERVAAISGAIGNPAESLKACKLDLDDLTLTLTPAGTVTFTIDEGGTRALIATGKKPFSAEILEAPVTGLSIEQPVLLGSKIVIKAEAKKVPAGSYTLHVVDGADHDAYATIKVEAKQSEK